MKKILVASDSFKGVISSSEIGQIFKKENLNTKIISISDGGEGFIDSLLQNIKNTKIIFIDTYDDMMNKIKARVLIHKDDAYIEVANIIGLNNYKNISSIKKTSFGVGFLIKKLMNMSKYKTIFIGLGGTSTSDGGFGAALGLGVKFLDKNKNPIKSLEDSHKIKYIIKTKMKTKCVGLSDVKNILLGENGAVNIFGSQKWMSKSEQIKREKELFHFSLHHLKYSKRKGAGSAGGLGYFIYCYTEGKIMSGIKYILKISNLKNISKHYDYLITGEGKVDEQSLNGKVPFEIAKVSKAKNILIAGKIEIAKNVLSKYFYKFYELKKDNENTYTSIKNTRKRIAFLSKKINAL